MLYIKNILQVKCNFIYSDEARSHFVIVDQPTMRKKFYIERIQEGFVVQKSDSYLALYYHKTNMKDSSLHLVPEPLCI